MMKSLAIALLLFAITPLSDAAERERARGVRRPPVSLVPAATAPDCSGETTQAICRESRDEEFAPLSADEVARLATGAAGAIADDRMTVAVVDRAGRVLAIVRKPGSSPEDDEVAVGLARTAAFFSHDMAPLSSRTVRFISGVHFPPGVKRAPNAALYGIENTNRGCDFNVEFNPGKCIPRATSVSGGPCNPFDQSGCTSGPVTGKPQPFDLHEGGAHPEGLDLRGPRTPGGLPVNPGGVPIYRVSDIRIDGDLEAGNASIEVDGPGHLLGGIGVAGIDGDHAEFAAFAAVAFAGGNIFPAPSFPLPPPGRVFIDGFRLPFVENGSRPAGTTSDPAPSVAFVAGPVEGGCAANRYLVGPSASAELSLDEVDAIIRRSFDTARKTQGLIRLPLGSYARMAIAVSDLEGNILALYRMPDATVFSVDVAVAKARNVVYFSSESSSPADLSGVPPGTAVTNRTIGFGAQPLYPAGIDFTEPGPFFDLFVRDLMNPCSQGLQPANPNQNGVVFFAGASPLYRDGVLVGGLGVSGDGVEQDDYVSFFGAGDFLPEESIRADQIFVRDVRLPFLKWPRKPLVATEVPVTSFEEPED